MIARSISTGKARVTNGFGLHLRAAAQLVHLATLSGCSVHIRHAGKSANAKSILGILALGIHDGEELEITVEGEYSEKVLKNLLGLICENFHEP